MKTSLILPAILLGAASLTVSVSALASSTQTNTFHPIRSTLNTTGDVVAGAGRVTGGVIKGTVGVVGGVLYTTGNAVKYVLDGTGRIIGIVPAKTTYWGNHHMTEVKYTVWRDQQMLAREQAMHNMY